MKESDKDELLSCDRYVNKRPRSVFYTKNVSPLLLFYVRAVYMQQIKDSRADIENYIHIDMGNLHEVDFIYNPRFLIPCLRPGFVYTVFIPRFCVVYPYSLLFPFTIPRVPSKECAFI